MRYPNKESDFHFPGVPTYAPRRSIVLKHLVRGVIDDRWLTRQTRVGFSFESIIYKYASKVTLRGSRAAVAPSSMSSPGFVTLRVPSFSTENVATCCYIGQGPRREESVRVTRTPQLVCRRLIRLCLWREPMRGGVRWLEGQERVSQGAG